MTPKQGRRADDISAEEIKQFWHGFCERKGVDADGQVAQTRRAVRTIARIARA